MVLSLISGRRIHRRPMLRHEIVNLSLTRLSIRPQANINQSSVMLQFRNIPISCRGDRMVDAIGLTDKDRLWPA
jgi:hypothetical protein